MMLYENPVYMTYGKLNDLVNIIFFCFINLVGEKKAIEQVLQAALLRKDSRN